MKAQPSEITVFDESLVRRLLQKITVFEDHITVEFKSGIRVDIEVKSIDRQRLLTTGMISGDGEPSV